MLNFKYKDEIYPVEIINKNNKNTYIRVKDKKIIVTTSYYTTKRQIEKLIYDNEKSIIKMIEKDNNKTIDNNIFKLFGKKYDIVYSNIFKKVEIENNKIYAFDEKSLESYLKKYIYNIFKDRLDYNYHLFLESIPYPNLRIRKMKTRWGVCNTKSHVITLNYELSRYEIKYLDYVIIHELSHLVYPNHSKDFWNLVSKYCSDYKTIRRNLRN